MKSFGILPILIGIRFFGNAFSLRQSTYSCSNFWCLVKSHIFCMKSIDSKLIFKKIFISKLIAPSIFSLYTIQIANLVSNLCKLQSRIKNIQWPSYEQLAGSSFIDCCFFYALLFFFFCF